MPAINPDILRWARETADFSLEEAAHAIDLKDAFGKTGAERLAALEAGEDEPTRRILVAMAQKYRRPLLVFYLREPPRKGDRGRDFRTVPDAEPLAYDATLDALIRDIKNRQSLVRSLMEDEESQPLAFINSFEMRQGTAVLVERIISTFSFQLSEFRSQRNINSAFAYLRSRMEAAGIFVMLAGNLGSHHSNIPAETFRGFAIADAIAPFVVINDQDARSAWSFTALHEAAHLWLGTTGISGAAASTAIEQFCNDVAGEILLPRIELQEIASTRFCSFDEAVEQIQNFATERKISRAMVAYKLFRSDYIGENRWRELNARFQQEWADSRVKPTNKDEGRAGGPNYYVVRRHRLGQAILGLIGRALTEGKITYTKAGQVLGVKPRNVSPLLRDISLQGDL